MEQTMKTILFLLLILKSASSQSLKGYGESCDGDCDERKGLTCSASKTCECMLSNTTMYDYSRTHCVTRVGHPCRRLVTSATASSTENLCVPNASCQALNLNCECDRNYFQTRNGTCAPVAKYGKNCSVKKICDKSAGMECVGSKNKQFQCQCKYPRDQYYDSDEQKCISYADGHCFANSFTLPCVKNANCSLHIFELKRGENLGKSYFYNATVGKKCQCLPAFRITKKRECLPSYQSPCDNGVCNYEEHLQCYDNKVCVCRNPLHQIYSAEKNKCLNLINTKCSPSTSSSSDSEPESSCVDGSECNDGICKCKSGFSDTPLRQCLLDFGSHCSAPGQCNFARGLSCNSNGTCSCFDDFLMYSPTLKTCLGQEGTPCGQFLLKKDGHNKAFQFMQIASETRACDNSPGESVTIECDSEKGLLCQRLQSYQQCA